MDFVADAVSVSDERTVASSVYVFPDEGRNSFVVISPVIGDAVPISVCVAGNDSE